MYRWIYIILIIISFLISTPEVSHPLETLSDKDPITPAKPLSTLRSITRISLSPAIVKRTYIYQITTEGKKPVFCKLIKGKLPAGLNLSKTGRISGVPSKSGGFLFDVRITDDKKQTFKYLYSLTVKPSDILQTDKPKADSKRKAISTKSSPSKFLIRDVRIFFSNEKPKITVSRKTKNHRAYAAVIFEGAGWLKGSWKLNGKTISRIKEYLDPTLAKKNKTQKSWTPVPGSKKRGPDTSSEKQKISTTIRTDAMKRPSTKSGNIHIITSPDLPVQGVPRKLPYQLKLIVTGSKQKELYAEAMYFVSETGDNQKPGIRLVSPPDKSEVDFAPTTFSWKGSKSAEMYAINFLDEKGEKVIFSANTKKALEFKIVPSEHKNTFSPEKEYRWDVTAFDKDNKPVAKSSKYRFAFLTAATHVTGQILVVLKSPGNTRKQMIYLSNKYKLDLIKSDAIRSLRQTVAVFRTKQDIYAVIKVIKKEKYVVTAQPNHVFRTMTEPMTEMQSIYRICRLNILHTRYTGKRVTIGIVDTGIDTFHKDLKGRIVNHKNFVDNHRYRGEIHGTAVAGIIGAGINDYGIAGVAPEVRIVALRACKQVSETYPAGKCQTYAISRALDTAIEMGADIVNMSFGSSAGDSLLRNLIQEGTRRGMVFVAPVGNRLEQEVLWFPASDRNVLAVAGTDENGNPFPNAKIAALADVCAPASNLLTTVPGQKHNFLNGTSMSSAVISGLIAIAHDRKGRIDMTQLPVFNGHFCEWEQELINISICDESF